MRETQARVRFERSKLWSWKLRTGDFVVQLEYADESSLAAESSPAAALAPLQLSHVSRPPGSLERLTNFSYFAYS